MTRNQGNRSASLLDANIRQIVREEFRSMLEGVGQYDDRSSDSQDINTSFSQSKLAGKTVARRSTAKKGKVTSSSDKRLKQNRVDQTKV